MNRLQMLPKTCLRMVQTKRCPASTISSLPFLPQERRWITPEQFTKEFVVVEQKGPRDGVREVPRNPA